MKNKQIFNLIFLFLVILTYMGVHYIRYRGDILSNQISARVIKDLLLTQDLYAVGFGGQMPDKIERLILAFEGYKEIDVNEARKLIVYGVSKFIDEVNSNKSIRPYLANDPFTAKNIEITIWLYKDPEHTQVSKNHIFFVKNESGTLEYYVGGSLNIFYETPILVETYEEAVKILEETKVQS